MSPVFSFRQKNRFTKMTKPTDVLKRIEGLPSPRHVFVLPSWATPGALDRLVDEGYVTCGHHQRDKNGAIHVAMNLNLTSKAERLLRPPASQWPQLALKGSLAGAGLTLMSLLVLYLA
jgi:hypothetical protein